MTRVLSMFLIKYLNLSMYTSMSMFPSLYMSLCMTHTAQNIHQQKCPTTKGYRTHPMTKLVLFKLLSRAIQA